MARDYRCTQCAHENSMMSPPWEGESMTGEVYCENCGEKTVQNQMKQNTSY